ncbi:MAG TPA: glycosyltransferase [Ureibacillus sp.]|nr:glycosyltransferase [Ureibacillus sp.]
MKPSISLCMIVKNEEKVLNRCLTSVSKFVDEIIIVDTGSSDNTKKIASEYTSNIYDFNWINDFSAARNFAASKASGEWILVLDADEYVDEENFQSFISELTKDNGIYDAYTAKILNFSGNFGEHLIQNLHDRVYKNNGEISYYRKIHEQFKNNDNTPVKTKNSSLLIFHSGYLNRTVKEKEKSERNKELLDLEMMGENNKDFDYFNFGNEYFSMGKYSEALEAYLKAYKYKRDFRLAWVSTTLIQIIICLINLKRYNEALSVLIDAENIYENSPEFLYLKSEIYFQRGQLDDAKSVLLELVNNPIKYSDIIIRPDLKDQKPHNRLGQIFLYQEDYNNAIYHYTSVLNLNNNHSESVEKVITILDKFYPTDEIISFLNSNHLINNINISTFAKACFDIGNINLAIGLLDNFSEQQNLLYKIALLKKYCISHEGNIEEFKSILEFDLIKQLMEANWINIIDLILLKEDAIIGDSLSDILKSLKKNDEIKKLIELFNGRVEITDIDENLITYSLQILFAYKNYSLCNLILDEIEKVDKKIIVKVSRILFANGFKAEALQLYDLCDWSDFIEEDFVNIINSLLETNNMAGAIDFAKYATIVYENDFRFYGYILLNTQETKVFNSTLIKAKEIFKESQYLQTFQLI